MPRKRPDAKAVFLNVPFDAAYEKQFLALLCALIALGRKPRCVLEIPDTGQGRLERIMAHISTCGVSIHDLSRVGTPVRFNMPFELGIACALTRSGIHHSFVLLERKQHRLARSLSDLRGIDPLIHNGRIRRTIACVLDVLQSRRNNPAPGTVFAMYRDLSVVARELRRQYGQTDVYSRSVFQGLVAATVELAVKRGLLVGRSAYSASKP